MHLSEQQFEYAMESFHKARVPAIFPHDESREMWTLSFVMFSPPNIRNCLMLTLRQDLWMEVQWSCDPDSAEKM